MILVLQIICLTPWIATLLLFIARFGQIVAMRKV